MAIYDLISLLRWLKGSDESAPKRVQRRIAGFLIALAFVIGIEFLFLKMKDHPGGIQIAVMVAYTCTFFGFFHPVPWNLLNRFPERILLGHALALAVVYAITTWAFAAEPHLSAWFVALGRRGSLFDWCLAGILLILQFYEVGWMLRTTRNTRLKRKKASIGSRQS